MTAKSVTLPPCVDGAAVAASVTANKEKSKASYLKYQAYEKAFAGEGDVEKVARLVYAEALAANCGEKTADTMPVIAEVIGNRIRARKGEVRSVLFEKDQFASSLNVYAESRYRDLLCPKDLRLWTNARAEAARALGTDAKSPPDLVHYFLQRHAARYPKPPPSIEALPEYSVKGPEAKCVRAFRNSSWR